MIKKLKKIKIKYDAIPVQVRASFWFLICSFLQRGISVITTPIFTRLMSTQEYGEYGTFNSWLDIVSIFVTFHMYAGVFLQGLVKYEDDRKRYASSIQCLSLTLCLTWTFIYLISKSFWNSLFGLTTVQMLAMMVMIWATGVFSFWASEQRVLYRYRILVLVTLLVSILKPALGIFLVLHAEDKVTARILGLAIAELIGYTSLFFAQVIRGKQFYSGKYWKHALVLSIPLIPHYLSQTVLNSSDRIMIRNMVGASEAGIYTLAYSISKIMTLFNSALGQTLNPWYYQKIKADKTEDISSVAYPALVGIAGVNIALIAFAPEVVAIFATKEYQNAIWVIPPVAMSVYFSFAYNMFSAFEFYFEKTGFIMIASVLAATCNVGLNYVFIRIFGYYAAGYTTLFCFMAYTIGHYYFMRRICKEFLPGRKPFDLKILLGITGGFLLLGFCFLLSYTHTIIRLVFIFALILVIIINRNAITKSIVTFLDIRGKRKKQVRKE